jgi:hypothetical protein
MIYGAQPGMSQLARISLSTKDVIHIEGFQGTASVFKNDSTVRIRSILQALQAAFLQSGMDLTEINALMEQGIPCEVLQPNAADWQVGALRLSLEFQPGVFAAPSESAAPVASTIGVQNAGAMASAAPVAAAVAAAPVVMEPISATEPEIDLESDFGLDTNLDLELSDDLSHDLDNDLDNDLSINLDSPALETGFGASFSTDLTDGLDDTFAEDSLGDLSIEGLDEDALEMSGFESGSDLTMETDLETDLDLSGLDEMNGLSDMMGDDAMSDDLSLGLDSQAVLTDNLDELSSPWDLSGDLDDMLLQHSHS